MKVVRRQQVDYLSASQINLYLLCSLKYRFNYIDRLPKPFKSSGLVFGSAVHSSLEWFAKERLKKSESSLEKLLKIFAADWFCQTVEAKIRYKNGESEKSLLFMGKQMLRQYFHSEKKPVVNAEIPFSLPLVDPISGAVLGVTLEGYIDLIQQGHEIVEFKTSTRTLTEQTVKDSVQLTCYSYAYEMLFQARPQRLTVVNLVKTRTPKQVILRTKRTKKDHQRLFHLAQEVLRGIKQGIFIPQPSWLCKDCEYAAPCKEWTGNGN